MTRPPHVLLVDDDTALLRALPETLRLRMDDIVVDTADSGTSAMERVVATDYDAIVTDIKMPGVDGLALLARIRELRPDTPTLLITGHGQHDLAVKALRGGAFDFIQKPIERDYFVASLGRAIRMRQLSRKVEEQRRALERHTTELERIVAERTRELRDADRAKDEFLVMLAHELRNPLAPIRNAVEIMGLDGSEAHHKQAREIIERQVAHMARLIEDLLDVSRVRRGTVELRKEQVEVAAVLAAAVEACMPAIEARGHELVQSVPPEPIYLWADPTRLEQVVTNLLHNATKYTEVGGRIWLSAAREGSEAVLRVRDNGVGITADMLPRVFDLFAQADQSLDRSHGGLGIGLTLVRHLVQLHGGNVSAASEGLRKGCEFTVRLPLAKNQSPGPAAAPRRARPGAVPDRPEGSALRVLVIEDHADSRRSLGDLLRLWGHRVVLADDGIQGVEMATTGEPPDVALVDIGLPLLDGYQVARRVRATPDKGRIFLVALTGYGRPDDRRRALDAGFDAHLVKPVNFDELARVLAAVPGHGSPSA